MIYSNQERELAEKLISHSVELQPDENILLQAIGFNSIGLVRALTEVVREMGAHPFVQLEDPEINRILLERGDEAFWERQSDADQLPLIKNMDAFIGIRGSENIYENAAVTPEANRAYSEKFLNPVHFKERVENTRRSEEHTSELQSRGHLVCRLLLEKKK